MSTTFRLGIFIVATLLIFADGVFLIGGTQFLFINDKTLYRHFDAAAASLQEDREALKHNFLLRRFFKKRGYEDSDELTKYEVSQLPATQPEKQFTYDASKLFDKRDSAKLKNQKALGEGGNSPNRIHRKIACRRKPARWWCATIWCRISG
jgi:hypothetical protein